MQSTTAGALIKVLDEIFDITGFPELVVTDNDPPFTAAELLKFKVLRGTSNYGGPIPPPIKWYCGKNGEIV